MKQQKQKGIGIALAIGAIFLLLGFFVQSGFYRTLLMRIGILCTSALGVYICYAVSHMMIFCQAAFMAVGAYFCGFLLKATDGKMILAVPCAVAVCLLFAWLLGFGVLKLTGDYFSMATIGIGEVVRLFFQNSDFFGSAAGMYNIPQQTTPILTGICASAALLCILKMERGVMFQKFRAVKSDVHAAQAIGINILQERKKAWLLCAGLGALAGAMMAGLNGFISPPDFTFTQSMDCVAAVVVGGFITPIGTVIAAFLIELSAVVFQSFAEMRMILYGICLIAVVAYRSHRGHGRKER